MRCLTLKQIWYNTNLFIHLPKNQQHTRCTRCNYVGCNNPSLFNHLQFLIWLHWNTFNPKKLYIRFKKWVTDFDYSQIDSIEMDGIDYRDYPDFSDAYISYAEYKGKEMTEKQLERLNENSSFVYECLMDKLY